MGSEDRTASVSAEEADGGTSADGGGGGCVCAVEEETAACVSAGEAREAGEAAESPLGCCWGHPPSVAWGRCVDSKLRGPLCCVW